MAKDIEIIKNSETHYTIKVSGNPAGEYRRIEVIEETDANRAGISRQHTTSGIDGIYISPPGYAKRWAEVIVANMKKRK